MTTLTNDQITAGAAVQPDLKTLRQAAEQFCADNLHECAAELNEWQSNGSLRDGKLRHLGELCEKYVGQHDGLKVAERMVEFDSVAAIARRAPSPQVADIAELPDLPRHEYCLNSPLPQQGYTESQMRQYARDAIAASRRAATASAGQAERECDDCDGTGRISPVELCARCKESGVLPGSAGQAAPAEQALLKLCDQLDGMKRRLLHTPGTGQHHSYLMHEDVEAYIEEARKSLAAQPAEGAGQASQVALDDLMTYPSPHGTLVRLADVKCRVWATERAAAPAELEQQLIERRIGLTPENEGGWHAQVYGDSETPLAKGYGATPSEAIRSATQQPSAQKGGVK